MELRRDLPPFQTFLNLLICIFLNKKLIFLLVSAKNGFCCKGGGGRKLGTCPQLLGFFTPSLTADVLDWAADAGDVERLTTFNLGETQVIQIKKIFFLMLS